MALVGTTGIERAAAMVISWIFVNPIQRMMSSEQASPGPQRVAQLVFLAASLVFAGTTAFLLQRPMPWLVGVVPDDAFYYLQIARHLIHDGRATFDGVNLTNGYHPGWMLVATACAGLVEDKERLLRTVLGAGFLLHYLATLLLTRSLAKLTGPYAAWMAGAVWLLNPFAQVLLLQGGEAPLFLLSLAVLLHVYLSRIEPALHAGDPTPPLSLRDAAWFGAALGFAGWARTEVAVSGSLWVVLVAYALWKRSGGRKAALRFVLVATVVCALVGMPWLVFSWASVGALAQDSGTMKLLWGAEQFVDEGTAFRVQYALYIILRVWLEMPLALSVLVPPSGIAAAVVLPPLALAILIYRRQPGAAGLYRLTIGLLVSTLITGGVYGGMLGDLQVWHLVQPALALFLLGFGWAYRAVLARAPMSNPAKLRVAGYLVVACAGVLHVRATFEMDGRYPWQRDAYASQAAFEALVPPAELIGTFNSGIPGYFSSRSIINLDGLANHAVVAYWQRRDFPGYLKESGIRYLLDEQTSLDRALRFSRVPLRLRSLGRARLNGWRTHWRLLWRVAPP